MAKISVDKFISVALSEDSLFCEAETAVNLLPYAEEDHNYEILCFITKTLLNNRINRKEKLFSSDVSITEIGQHFSDIKESRMKLQLIPTLIKHLEQSFVSDNLITIKVAIEEDTDSIMKFYEEIGIEPYETYRKIRQRLEN